jgi:NADH:quinone reductase (non-electrogenic)
MESPKIQVIVIGAGYAGLLATTRLAGKTDRKRVQITLVNASDLFVERVRLHQFAANQPVKQRPIEQSLRGTGVTFVQGVVTRLNTERREVILQNPSGIERLPYDYVLYALGSTIERDSVPGVRDYAYTLTPGGPLSAAALREVLPAVAQTGGRMLVVGGGATGIETAAEFAEAYPTLHVSLVTQDAFGAFMPPHIQAEMRQALTRLKVSIHEHKAVREIKAHEAVLDDGSALSFDLCLWAGGFTVPSVARDSGMAVNERGQILIDPYMRSISHLDIYAVGDSAFPAVETGGVAVRMSAFTAAVMGAHGADTLSAALNGKKAAPLGFIYVGQAVSLGKSAAVGFRLTPDDKPTSPLFTGKLAARIREVFVHYLGATPMLERYMPFWWMGKSRAVAGEVKTLQNRSKQAA